MQMPHLTMASSGGSNEVGRSTGKWVNQLEHNARWFVVDKVDAKVRSM